MNNGNDKMSAAVNSDRGHFSPKGPIAAQFGQGNGDDENVFRHLHWLTLVSQPIGPEFLSNFVHNLVV